MLIVGLCVTAYARQKPAPDWGVAAAQGATPGYAKDAESVILYDEIVESVDADGRAVETEHEAIRVLAPQGRSDAVCALGYDVDEKIQQMHAWTITAGGQQFEANEKDAIEIGDTSIPVMLSTYKARILKPPAVDVGATVVCETVEQMASYLHEESWGVQSELPVVDQSLELDLPAGMSYAVSWRNMDALKPVEVAPNHWRWEVKDERPLDLRDVPSHPNRTALAARASIDWGELGVQGTDNRWRAIGNFASNLEAGRPDPTPEITAETQQLIAGAPDFFSRVQRITEYIQKNVRYFVVERGIGGWQAHPAGEIFRNRYGDCKDKTTLLISMLRVAGIQAFYVPVDDRRGVVAPDAPSFYGNHMIAAIEIPAGVQDKRLQAVVTAKNGKRYLIFDPTNEAVPAGTLPSYEQGGYGLLADGQQSWIMALPVLGPEASVAVRKGSFALAADGTLTGTVSVDRDGTQGANLRLALKDADQKEQRENLERNLAGDLPGVALNSFTYADPPALEKPVSLDYSVTAGQYAHQAGNLLLVRPRVVGTDGLAFDDHPRTVPIDLQATGEWRDSFDIKLPAGYVVDELPDPVNVDMGFASYHSKSTAEGGVLHYERDYEVKKVQIPAADSLQFRKLESAILSDERGTAVLRQK
ncbi:MAG TPA: DUF3857 and transglutaminase domain-containing protein [Terracidiphilus sp.]|nr:DUF3857 and transglutaminase domain-containing protein [Terracidiphilus sp.]